jgi:hypothetical protein
VIDNRIFARHFNAISTARGDKQFSDVHDGEDWGAVACENNMFVEGGAVGTGPSVCSVWNSVSSPEGEK